MAPEPLVDRALVEAASRLSLSPTALAKARKILDNVPNPAGGPLRDHVGAAAFIAAVVAAGDKDETDAARRLGLSLSQLQRAEEYIAKSMDIGLIL